MNGKRVGLGAFGGTLAVTCVASVAWACTYQPHMSLNSESGGRSSTVTISGQARAQDPVAVHWNSRTGPTLASVTADSAGRFVLPVTIPADATPEVHFLVAVTGDTGIATSAFEVTAPGQAAGPAATGDSSRLSQGDAWNGGFSQTRTNASHGASMVDGTAAGSSAPGMAVGLGLLAGGALVLGGLGVATARRRATVRS